MSRFDAVLRQRESYPESRLPPGVQPLQRPAVLGRAVELAFLRWEKRKLAPVERFWRDFGMHIVSASPECVVARGTGPAPCIAIAVRGSRDRFIGHAFCMSEDTDLKRYVEELGAKWLATESIPGGGRGIELFDPSGRSVWLLQGQRRVECVPLREALVATTNTAHHVPRVNRTVRTPIEPAQVVKLGHVVMQTVDFPRMAEWYLKVLGLIPTDVHYLTDGSPTLRFAVSTSAGSQPTITASLWSAASRRNTNTAPTKSSISMHSAKVNKCCGHRATDTCGVSVGTCSAASSSITGSIRTASNTSTTPTATCSRRTSKRRTRRSSSAPSGHGATMPPPR